MKLVTLPGVFAPISDSWMLADAIREERLDAQSRVLDVCTGSGLLALTAADCGAAATAIDVSRRALLTVQLNAFRAGLHVRTLRGRTFGPVAGERFDLIVSNPPYVPSFRPDVPAFGARRAWEAGYDGRIVLDALCDGAAAHLRPGGALLVVHSSLIGIERTIERLRRTGLVDVDVTARVRGPLGPLMRAQQKAGTIAADIEEEDVAIIRACAPPAG
ncbi:HemK2/MTQ2 family protein methyltransferase [Kribbella sp. VKM Ac-2566]|uniref:HemK2/MTQ2 family protein methyltransferase n=1 Tax=Kribbella sp. VKM Ac-2566 TaxID=2512218 RepID=UPI00106273CD|nr:HemK2/MTQ2 family protein methyltransferase [Kribbella sp. VKM Ac-2566]TDW98582.1 release factor glutamine methyltransferase [Kribbella sp. VKM Ac-2566]